MSAQIIQLSDHRKVRRPTMMNPSLKIFVACLALGAAINEAIIEAARVSLKNEN
jgi:hypothetical protein